MAMDIHGAETKKQKAQGRRGFILGLTYLIPSVIGLTLAGSIGPYLFGKRRTEETEDWTDAADISDLNSGSPRRILFERTLTDGWEVRKEKSSAWVVLDEKRQAVAFSPLCTHLGCAYNWEPSGKKFSCPCHGSAFDAQGNVIHGPAARSLDRYLTKREGNRLWLGPLQNEPKA